jgi:hypothetical protein
VRGCRDGVCCWDEVGGDLYHYFITKYAESMELKISGICFGLVPLRMAGFVALDGLGSFVIWIEGR